MTATISAFLAATQQPAGILLAAGLLCAAIGTGAGLYVARAMNRRWRRGHHERIQRAVATLDLVVRDAVGHPLQPETMPDGSVPFDSMMSLVEEKVRTASELVYRDASTGLFNALGLQRHIGAGSRDGEQLFVAALGINRFGRLKSQVGHELTTELVRSFGARLGAMLQDAYVARLDTDVLGVAFAARTEADAAALLERSDLLGSCQVDVAGCSLEVAIKAGLASATGMTPSEALDRARSALEQARLWNRRLVHSSAAEFRFPADRLSMIRDLRAGLARGEMSLRYQPKFRARTNELYGVEALLRWKHPVRGMISPEEFIPLAEEAGDIWPLTEWVLSRVMQDQAKLADAGFGIMTHVNISGCLIGDPRFGRVAADLIRDRRAPIGFEITETAVIEDPNAALANLELLADAGVRLAIDDYGSGMSSLAYLKKLPVHELKIDKMFISGLTQSHRDPMLVRSTIDLAHGLGMEVTAEGVETLSALALLRVMGCDLVQGYLLACPMPFDDLLAFLTNEQRLAHIPTESPSVIRPASYWEKRAYNS